MRYFFVHATTLILSISLMAGEVNLPHTFQPNTKANAGEVNANFNTVKDAVNDNHSKIQNLEILVQQLKQQNQQLQQQVQQLQQQIVQLKNKVQSIEDSNIMAVNEYIQVTTPDPDANIGVLITFSGVNLQIVNGTGKMDQVNGLGNLIIGYNSPRQDTNINFTDTCSFGQYWNDPANCTANGGVWGKNFKTGSHNLIVGDKNAYSSYGGIVAGFGNVISRKFAVVMGGLNNISTGQYSSISGGGYNTASGMYSSVSGGTANVASGLSSSVSGGAHNIASGTDSSVSGGGFSDASGWYSSVSGGYNNTAGDPWSTISGGNGCNIPDDNVGYVKWGAKKSNGTPYGDCP